MAKDPTTLDTRDAQHVDLEFQVDSDNLHGHIRKSMVSVFEDNKEYTVPHRRAQLQSTLFARFYTISNQNPTSL